MQCINSMSSKVCLKKKNLGFLWDVIFRFSGNFETLGSFSSLSIGNPQKLIDSKVVALTNYVKLVSLTSKSSKSPPKLMRVVPS